MISDPLFYLVAIPAILIFGMSKGGVGGASAALAVPLMALVVDPLLAAAVMLPLLVVMDFTALFRFLPFCEWRHIKRLLPAAFLGVLLASLLMGRLSADGLRLAMGILGLIFCAAYLLEYSGAMKALKGWRPGIVAAGLWGGLAGFASAQVHAGGIPASIYLYRQGMDRYQLTGTSAVFFTALNLFKLGPYASLNLFTGEVLLTALMLSPLAPLGVLLGKWLLPRIREHWYYPSLVFFLGIASARLVWVGLSP